MISKGTATSVIEPPEPPWEGDAASTVRGALRSSPDAASTVPGALRSLPEYSLCTLHFSGVPGAICTVLAL